MIGPRSRRAIAVASICTAATAGAAYAQSAAAPVGNYGGGAIGLPVSEKTIAKDMLLAIRARPGGRIGVDGQLAASCAPGTITGDAKLAPDGSFTLRGTSTRRPLLGVTETTTFVVKGTLTADAGHGTASVTVRVRAKRRATRTCRSRTVSWALRHGGVPGAPAPAPAESTLYGLTSQSGPHAKRALVLHATSGGRSIDRLVMGYRVTCDSRRVVVSDDVNFSPEFDVNADGSFRTVERFKRTFADVSLSTTVVVHGQFDQTGGAAGKLSVTERYTDRKTGRGVDACTTGTQTWSARS
jgi:hypothetical protein